jgi:hypothetical protein
VGKVSTKLISMDYCVTHSFISGPRFGSAIITSTLSAFDLVVVTIHSRIRYCLRVVVAAGHRA